MKLKERIRQKGKLLPGAALLYFALKWTLIFAGAGFLKDRGLWQNSYLLILPLIALTVLIVKKRRKNTVKEA